MKSILIRLVLILFTLLNTQLILAQQGAIAFELLPEIKGLNTISPKLISSGLPSSEHFAQLAKAGVEAVISVIPPTAAEPQPDLAAIQEAGIIYLSVPFNLSSPVVAMESFIAAMESLEGRCVATFCASNNRASIMLYIYHKLTSGEFDAAYLRPGLDLVEFLASATTIYSSFVEPIEEHYNIKVE